MARIAMLMTLLSLGPAGFAAESEGERLAYLLGCVNCHHQTPKDIINAPPLLVTQSYSPEQFTTLLKTGVTSSGRDLSGIGSIMGIIAIEQFSLLNEDEIAALYTFLSTGWTNEQALMEEAKIPELYKSHEGHID